MKLLLIVAVCAVGVYGRVTRKFKKNIDIAGVIKNALAWLIFACMVYFLLDNTT